MTQSYSYYETDFNSNLYLYNLNQASYPLSYVGENVYQDAIGDIDGNTVWGISADTGDSGSTLDIDAIKFFMSSGNIASGVFHLYIQVTA